MHTTILLSAHYGPAHVTSVNLLAFVCLMIRPGALRHVFLNVGMDCPCINAYFLHRSCPHPYTRPLTHAPTRYGSQFDSRLRSHSFTISTSAHCRSSHRTHAVSPQPKQASKHCTANASCESDCRRAGTLIFRFATVSPIHSAMITMA